MKGAKWVAIWVAALAAFVVLEARRNDATNLDLASGISLVLQFLGLIGLRANSALGWRSRIGYAVVFALLAAGAQQAITWLMGLPRVPTPQVTAWLLANIAFFALMMLHGRDTIIAGTALVLLWSRVALWNEYPSHEPWEWVFVITALLLVQVLDLCEQRLGSLVPNPLRRGTVLALVGLVYFYFFVIHASSSVPFPVKAAYTSLVDTAVGTPEPFGSFFELPVTVRIASEEKLLITDEVEVTLEWSQGDLDPESAHVYDEVVTDGQPIRLRIRTPPDLRGVPTRARGTIYLTTFHSPRKILMNGSTGRMLPELGRCGTFPEKTLGRVICRTSAPGPDFVTARFLSLPVEQSHSFRVENRREYSRVQWIPSITPIVQTQFWLPQKAGYLPEVEFTTWRRGRHVRAAFEGAITIARRVEVPLADARGSVE